MASCLALLFTILSHTPAFGADADHCAICGKLLSSTIYTLTDKVTHERVFLCRDCAAWPDECYICGLPARTDSTSLPDGRFLCSRDAKTAVLDAAKANEVCQDIKDKLDRLFSRFMAWPSTNVTVRLVDRVDLLDEFTVVGNNFECPDVLGYIHSQTNRSCLDHVISMMTALPLAEFQATCAHEYTHAWVFENVSAERRKKLNRDAHEGFCELMAYLLMDSLHEQEQMDKMLRNTYTRGQIQAFIAAEKEYGLNDILDWVRWGVSGRLKSADLGDIRNVQISHSPSAPPTNLFIYPQIHVSAEHLALKGISTARSQRLALINDETMAAGETAMVHLGTNQVMIRCLAIGDHSVRVQLVNSGMVTELQLSSARTH